MTIFIIDTLSDLSPSDKTEEQRLIDISKMIERGLAKRKDGCAHVFDNLLSAGLYVSAHVDPVMDWMVLGKMDGKIVTSGHGPTMEDATSDAEKKLKDKLFLNWRHVKEATRMLVFMDIEEHLQKERERKNAEACGRTPPPVDRMAVIC